MAKKKTQLAKQTTANKKLLAFNKSEAKKRNKAISDDLKKRASVKKLKVKALVNTLSGKYNLPYGLGQEFDVEEKQAKLMVKNKDVAFVK